MSAESKIQDEYFGGLDGRQRAGLGGLGVKEAPLTPSLALKWPTATHDEVRLMTRRRMESGH